MDIKYIATLVALAILFCLTRIAEIMITVKTSQRTTQYNVTVPVLAAILIVTIIIVV